MRVYTAGAAIAATLLLLPTATAAADDPPRYEAYYSIFTRGERNIPNVDTTPYVPQGLAYWPEEDAMLISYYHEDEDGGHAILEVVDRVTSAPIKTVVLDDTGHAQALAMSENHLWLASTGINGTGARMVRYAKADLAATSDDTMLHETDHFTLRAHSFVEITGNTMYVGTFHKDTKGTAYRYRLDAGEKPVYDGHYFPVPPKVQGMAITSTHFVWSRSWGKDNDSEIAVDPRSGAITRRVVAPNMSEDLATVGGEIYVVYESGARKYAEADYKVRTIHHGPLAELIP